MSSDRDARVGILLDESVEFSLVEVCTACRVRTEVIIELVDVGVVEPRGREPEQWRFPGPALRRMQRALRLQYDLDINAAGAALVLDLLDEVEQLRSQVRILKGALSR